MNSPLDDMEILKDILNGKIQIKDLDDDLKARLINLCNKRTEEVNKKIEDKKKEIEQIRKVLKKLPQ